MEYIKVVTVVTLCVTVYASRQASTPSYILLGKSTGDILRCPIHQPWTCELLYTSNYGLVDILVHNERLYTRHNNGEIRVCGQEKNQCDVFRQKGNQTDNLLTYWTYYVSSFTVLDEYLYATGIKDVLRYKLNELQSFSTVYTFKTLTSGAYGRGEYLYFVSGGDLFRCSKATEMVCLRISTGGQWIGPVAGWSDAIINLTGNGILRACNLTTNTCSHLTTLPGIYNDIAVFKGVMYVVKNSGNVLKCDRDARNCSNFVHHEDVMSISFVYGTHRMEWWAEPGDSVFSYSAEHRGVIEARVVDGKLVNARGAVDTRRADVGYSGRAAIFAMAPSGQILVSHAHRSGLINIASLFAGQPVAGAGEIQVENGIIKRIVACSAQYRADVHLNRQVVHELQARGYNRADEISLEECPRN